MSETTHDLTQRLEELKRDAADMIPWLLRDDFIPNCDTRDTERVAWLIRDLSAVLVQAEQREAELKHHEALIEAQTQRGITDCSTPLFVRVQNIVEQLTAAEATVLTLQVDREALQLKLFHTGKDRDAARLDRNRFQQERTASEARLATQEATIRQVEQEMREMLEHERETGMDAGALNLARWADTLRAILPAEQTGVTHE